MKHVVSFSTGLSSALCVERVHKRYSADSMRVVFMDTLIEDNDNYRFAKEMYSRWLQDGIELVFLTEGREPYRVARDHNIIANQKLAPCTFELKIEPFVKYLESLSGDLTIHISYDFTEVARCEATRKNYEARGWSVDFPLLWKPYEMRPYSEVARTDWGIEPPRMYEQGYSHANCGGVCVKQGQGDWLRTLINYPERYAKAEQWEREMRDHPVRKDYALLRDQSNGTVKPMTLETLRKRNEGQSQLQPSLFDNGCVVCGVGDFSEDL